MHSIYWNKSNTDHIWGTCCLMKPGAWSLLVFFCIHTFKKNSLSTWMLNCLLLLWPGGSSYVEVKLAGLGVRCGLYAHLGAIAHASMPCTCWTYMHFHTLLICAPCQLQQLSRTSAKKENQKKHAPQWHTSSCWKTAHQLFWSLYYCLCVWWNICHTWKNELAAPWMHSTCWNKSNTDDGYEASAAPWNLEHGLCFSFCMHTFPKHLNVQFLACFCYGQGGFIYVGVQFARLGVRCSLYTYHGASAHAAMPCLCLI